MCTEPSFPSFESQGRLVFSQAGMTNYGTGQSATRAAVVYQTLRCEVVANCDRLAKAV